jgi:hypothetical protein
MWKLDASGRIAHWRAFRLTLSGKSLEQAIQATADFWQSCPHQPYYLDPNEPETWPSAWDLLTENYYCDIAKALGMLYTISYSVHGHKLPMKICVYYDPETGYEYNLAVFDEGKYVINLLDGQIVNITQVNEKFRLKHCYDSATLKIQ